MRPTSGCGPTIAWISSHRADALAKLSYALLRSLPPARSFFLFTLSRAMPIRLRKAPSIPFPANRITSSVQCALKPVHSTHARLHSAFQTLQDSLGGSSMNKKSFVSSGRLPTLISAFLYFDVSFMVWVIFGPMTPFIADQMHLSATHKGLLTAIPLLGGSFFRPILGLLADRLEHRPA